MTTELGALRTAARRALTGVGLLAFAAGAALGWPLPVSAAGPDEPRPPVPVPAPVAGWPLPPVAQPWPGGGPGPAEEALAPPLGETPAAAAAPAASVPMNALFTADRLEALASGRLPGARGAWREVTFASPALGRDDSYLAWLPPGYEASTRSYPTLYLLHGVGGPAGNGVEEWLGYGLTEDLDRMLAAGLLEPLIVVLPNGERGYWMNHADGGPRWADFVAVDLVNNVDATFRTDARRERRAVGGLSMGGHGALQLALNHPDRFAVAGAHSPTLRPFETAPAFFGDPFWFARYDPLSLVRASDAATRITTWIDIGDTDPWRSEAERLGAAQAAAGGPLTFRILEGEHEGWYWQLYLPEYLHFYSAAMSSPTAPPQPLPLLGDRPPPDGGRAAVS